MTTPKIEDFTPTIVFDERGHIYAVMLVELRRCAVCSKPMIGARRDGGTFPTYQHLNFDAQCRRAGWELRGYVSDEKGDEICSACSVLGLASFICALCGEKRPTTQITESFGYPAESLCMLCYDTVPAKRWREKTKELEESHKWDFDV